MIDYESLFEYGEKGKFVYTVCEIPKNSMIKVEFDREKKVFLIDRVEPKIFAKPVSYGFIPQTTDDDGDPLDTLIVTEEPVSIGVVVKSKVVAVLNFIDGDESDHKIVCVPEDDRNSGNNINDLNDLSEQWKKQIEHHFNHYKDLKRPGTTKVEGWGDAKKAWEIIEACSDRYKK